MGALDNRIVIVRNEDRTLQLGISESNGAPYDLTGATVISMALENEDGTTLTLTLASTAIAVVDAKAGTLSATITDTQSALLLVGNSMTFHIAVTIGGLVRKAVFDGLLTVLEETP